MTTEKRLIDADLLWQEVRDDADITGRAYQAVKEHILGAKTVDAVEVVNGRWRYYSTTMQECSVCQRHTARHKFKYCPHCGAVMEDKYNESTD